MENQDMQTQETWGAIASRWPSVKSLAEDLQVNHLTVYKWLGRNSVPSKYWETMIAAAKDRNIYLDPNEMVRLSSRTK